MVSLNIAPTTTTTEVAGMTWEEWQAFLQSVQECTCKPDSALACPACRDFYQRDWTNDPKHLKTWGS
ncbi:MAG: hypothetical protein ACYSW6_10110, partial [Planctomycetota bacterium]